MIIEHGNIIQCSADEAEEILAKPDHGVGGVINMAWNIENYRGPMKYDRWMPVLAMPAKDDEVYPPEWFGPILSFYDWVMRQEKKILVHCYMGQNRSRGVFGLLLVARHGKTASEAFKITGDIGYWHWRVAFENYEKHLHGVK